MRYKLCALLIMLIILSGCSISGYKDNEIYHTADGEDRKKIEFKAEELATHEDDRFLKVDLQKSFKFETKFTSIVAISPDGITALIQEFTKNSDDESVILGKTSEKVSLVRVDLLYGKREVLAKDIPFIINAKWNCDGQVIALGDGKNLRLYDISLDKFIMENELKNQIVSNFGWSPDGRVLYTEHPNLPNGSIIYLDTKKVDMAYETSKNIYIKAMLDKEYYYATRRDEGTSLSYTTIIVDSKGKEVKELMKGRLRDSWGKSIIQSDENGFGLYYIPDINNPEDMFVLTKKYAYDAKFVNEGKVAYIIDDKYVETQAFQLCVFERENKKTNIYSFISGSSFMLSPDGSYGIINGRSHEGINFNTGVIYSVDPNENETTSETRLKSLENSKYEEAMLRAIRGAVDTIYRKKLVYIKDLEFEKKVTADKYFVDTSNPEQWAKFDIMRMFEGPRDIAFVPGDEYILQISMARYKKRLASDSKTTNGASVTISIHCENSKGGALSDKLSFEMVLINKSWYVTGISTFPDSEQYGEVKKAVEGCIKDAQTGKILWGTFKGKNITAGQIQFFQSNIFRYADDVDNADYCRVYLKVNEENKELIYRLGLRKVKDKGWKAVEFRNSMVYD